MKVNTLCQKCKKTFVVETTRDDYDPLNSVCKECMTEHLDDGVTRTYLEDEDVEMINVFIKDLQKKLDKK